MARRDRTTGLPRPRPRKEAKSKSRFSMDEGQQLRAVWAVGGLLIAVLVLVFGYRWFEANYLHPDKTILRVGGEKYSLRYYTDRLFLAAQSNAGTGTNVSILEQTLLTELEDEALAKILAQEKGITVSDEETSAEIAAQLGVPAGGAGSTFDTLYRQRLTTVKMSDGAYRRYTEAQVYINKLKAKLAEEIGNTGEVVTLRAVVLASKEDADKVLARVNTGENLGSVAQAASTDISSRQNDGLMEPTPARMLPDAIRAAIDGKSAGSDLIGPLEVAGSFWVFRIEKRDTQGVYTETQKGQLADFALQDGVAAKRSGVTIKLDMDSRDYEWANEHAGD